MAELTAPIVAARRVDGLRVLDTLERFYGALPLPPADPFRAYVWDVLSAQNTAPRRDAAWQALQRHRGLTPDGMWRLPRRVFDGIVALAGPYHEQRESALSRGIERFRRDPLLPERLRGPLRAARRAVAVLPRVGVGSAHRLLLFGGGHRVMPVDPDVTRFWHRMTGDGGPATPHPRRLRGTLEAALPQDARAFTRAVVYLRHHAAQTCTPEPHCGVCPLRAMCARTGTSGPATAGR